MKGPLKLIKQLILSFTPISAYILQHYDVKSQENIISMPAYVRCIEIFTCKHTLLQQNKCRLKCINTRAFSA